MRTIETSFETFGASVLLLGYKNDNLATKVEIDCADALEEYQGATVTLSIIDPEGTVYPGDVTIEAGVVTWLVKARDTAYPGHGSARLDLVDNGGTVVASCEGVTLILNTHMSGVAPDAIEDWVDEASDALTEVRALLLDLNEDIEDVAVAEAARVLAEQGRVSAEELRVIAENTRVSAESGRVTAEQGRVNAEQGRVTAEQGRVTAEQGRVTAEQGRVTAEQGRVTAEQGRVTAEQGRVTAEQGRVAAETTRQQYEEQRESNETTRENRETSRRAGEGDRQHQESLRRQAETIRDTNETNRVTAEQGRASAEQGRMTAEAARETAEGEREEGYSTIEQNAQAALSYIGPSEATSTASAAHAKGSYLIYNGKLYQVTADITVGDTLATTGEGANIAQAPGGAMGEVAALTSALNFINDTIPSEKYTDFILNKYYNRNNGNTINLDGWAIIDKIPISNGYKYSLNGADGGFMLWTCIVYSDSTYLGYYALNTTRNARKGEITAEEILGDYPTATKIAFDIYSATTHSALTNDDVVDWYVHIANIRLENIESDISAFKGDMYIYVHETLDTEILTGFYLNGRHYDGTSLLQTKKADVSGWEKVTVSGTFTNNYDYYDFLDVNGNVVSYLQNKTGGTDTVEMLVDIPANAKYIVSSTNTEDRMYGISFVAEGEKAKTDINAQAIEELNKKLDIIAPSEKVIVTLSNNNITITQKFNEENLIISAIKHDTARNGLFRMQSYSGAYTKTASDEISPINLNGTNKGASHGDDAGILITATAHGKTIADIGSKYKGANDVVITIVKIVDADKLLVIGEPVADVLTPISGRRFVVTLPTAPLTHVSGSGGTNTGNINTFTATQYYQILPSVNNYTQKIYMGNSEVTEDGRYECEEFHVVEEYGIIDTYKMYLTLVQNVGNNDNSSYYADTLEDEIIFRTEYVFDGYGRMYVYSSILPIRDNIVGLTYGIVQAETAGNKTLIPFSTTFDTPTTQSGVVNMLTADWESAYYPPYKFYQLNDSVGFVLGYDVTFGLAKPSERKSKCAQAYNSPADTKKMYPKFVYYISPNQYEAISGFAYRMPVKVQNNVIAFSYKSANYDIIELEVFDAKTGKISVPIEMDGKHIEIVHGDSTVKLSTDIVIGSEITFAATGAGSCTIKVS